MSPEDAYAILESIANISGTIDRLKKVKPEVHEIENEKVAAENQKAVRRGSFRSGECGIPIGAEHIYVDGPSIKIMVVDDRHIQYGNETIPPLSALAKRLKAFDHPVQGTLYFKYNGEILNDLRDRLGK